MPKQLGQGPGTGASNPLEGHTSCVSSVAFSDDGKRIISGSFDCTIRIWNAETGAAVSEPLEGHTDPVLSVAFSGDGKRIVSGSENRTIRIWDAETSKVLYESLHPVPASSADIPIASDSPALQTAEAYCEPHLHSLKSQSVLG